MKNQILHSTRHHLLLKHKFFKINFTKESISKIAEQMEEIILEPEKVLNKSNNYLYIIISGLF